MPPKSVAICTSVSDNIADMARLTVPNKLEYCLRHGYSLVIDNQPYSEAMANTHFLCRYLARFDLVWTLDADAIITNMDLRIEQLPCLGPHMTVCEEGIVEWNRINCGSMVWRSTPECLGLLQAIHERVNEWKALPCIWQTWLQHSRFQPSDVMTVAPLRAFNSCAWNWPANGKAGGCHWQPGDFVFHANGVYPHQERLNWIERVLQQTRG